MNEFMIDVSLHDSNTPSFMSLIPLQRKVINNLMLEGILTGYCVSLDRSKMWATIAAKNEEAVFAILSQFPLLQFMDIAIYPLLFHNQPINMFSQISLN